VRERERERKQESEREGLLAMRKERGKETKRRE
jgi:hypothetical protein